MLTPAVSDWSSRAIQVCARLRYSGFWLTTRIELSRPIGWNLITFWLMPPSPESMIFSISEISGSGVELRTGKMPTDCPFIQSASKERMVSIAAARSVPLPLMISVLRLLSGRSVLALTPKASSSLNTFCAET